jgi:hypothetical protein
MVGVSERRVSTGCWLPQLKLPNNTYSIGNKISQGCSPSPSSSIVKAVEAAEHTRTDRTDQTDRPDGEV